MAAIVHHGAQCCGVRHIFGMDNTTVAELERHIAAVDAIPVNGGSATSGRLIEIILSSRQVGEPNPRGGTGNRWAPCVAREGGWPAVLQRLGFRLVSRFENKNSGADCYIFHRVPHFKSLRTGDLSFDWDHGAYQRQAAVDAGGPGPMAAPGRAAPAWNVGDRIRYNGTNDRAGMTATITAVVPNTGWDDHPYRYNLRFGDGVVRERYTATHFVRVDTPAPVVPQAPLVVATFFANVLQTGIGAFFPTVEAARAAAPRCRTQARIEIRSDGTRNTVNL